MVLPLARRCGVSPRAHKIHPREPRANHARPARDYELRQKLTSASTNAFAQSLNHLQSVGLHCRPMLSLGACGAEVRNWVFGDNKWFMNIGPKNPYTHSHRQLQYCSACTRSINQWFEFERIVPSRPAEGKGATGMRLYCAQGRDSIGQIA